MTDTTLERAPVAFKRTRIVLQDAELVRPMLALSVNKDGGLMIDLCKYAPVEHFRYGVVDVPAGEGLWQAPIRKDESSWSTNLVPKLHYHRSGYISLNATEQLERQGVQATPIGEIGPQHKHCFSFIARHPHTWDAVPRRKSDLVFTPSCAPETVTLAGFVGPTSNLNPIELTANPAALTVEQEDGTLVPTVMARFETDWPSYYVWVELHADRQFGNGDNPGLILYALDPDAAANHAAATPIVGVWSVPAADVEAVA